jgi:hypothetical protein
VTIDRDPLQRLRALNPVAAGQYDDLVGAPPARALFEQIVADDRAVRRARGTGPVARPRPTTFRPSAGRRRSTGVAVGAGALVLSAGVAGYAVIGRRPTAPLSVACFANADLLADTDVVPADGRGPVAACAEIWAGGGFGAPAAPRLRACVLDSGVVGVFPEAPGADVCLALGLAGVSAGGPPGSGPATSGPATSAPSGPGTDADDAGAFLTFRDAVLVRFLDQACVEPGRAAAVVREELDRAGLGDWTVSPDGGGARFTVERPCASLGFRPEEKTVELVPIPRSG